MSSIRTFLQRPRRLFRPVSDYLERELAKQLYTDIGREELFLEPPGEPAFVPPDSLTAKIYAAPLTVFIGGVTAVILELAEPRVRHGVWDHSIFPTDPVLRLRRTGLAAMVSFYAARSVATQMIEGISQRHAKIEGKTDQGVPYRASDPELLTWVQATAAFGFIRAYDRYAEGLPDGDWTTVLQQSEPIARAYGVPQPPARREALDRLIENALPRLEPSPTLQDFLTIMRTAPALPGIGRHLQPLFVRAAVSLLPRAVAERTALEGAGLRPGETMLVQLLVRGSRLASLRNHPSALAQQRLSKTGTTR